MVSDSMVSIISVCGPEGTKLGWKILAQLHIIITRQDIILIYLQQTSHGPAVLPPTHMHLSSQPRTKAQLSSLHGLMQQI